MRLPWDKQWVIWMVQNILVVTLCDGFKKGLQVFWQASVQLGVYVSPLSILAGFLWGFCFTTFHQCLFESSFYPLYWSFRIPIIPFPASLLFSLLLFSCSVVSNSLWHHGLQHARLPCPSLSPRVCSNSCPLSQWCHPTISSSCPQSFLASGSLPMSQLFNLIHLHSFSFFRFSFRSRFSSIKATEQDFWAKWEKTLGHPPWGIWGCCSGCLQPS